VYSIVAAQAFLSPRPRVAGTNRCKRRCNRAQVRPVDRTSGAGRLLRVRHPEQEPALLGPPVEARVEVERHRGRVGVEGVRTFRDRDLMADVPDPGARAGRRRHGLECRATGEQDAGRRDRPGGVSTAVTSRRPRWPARVRIPTNPTHSRSETAARCIRERVRADVPRRIDPAVRRDVRAPAIAVSGHRGDQVTDLVDVDPAGSPGRPRAASRRDR
jgi:hypothetical protein